MYLVDTNVISAAAPALAASTSGLVDWMDRHSARLFLSVITIAEIDAGIARLRRRGSTARAARLAEWLDGVLHLYADHVLPIDLAVGRRIGVLTDLALGSGLGPGLADLAIAATAQAHGYTVLTRNLRHFRELGVTARDPFDTLPPDGA